ncbi:putative cyclic di-GMP phosphodiesterase [Zhongshania aliphaticivorans]|uniref:Putative cyclic di-GMP phosphodiesterase n=1 Tax=Zhongshania aliphaticivorans TaxID=1470434 RepID=A0A5S9MYJ8_9GAMM|nr:response regulator [Zhongshania aliphaticivorans]CAA0082220.1 putative cyclic di-GMP phosphodiesterase [Zhongshania aliphaticivorans]CAA0084495.1 putative cyclic di-GMP phosphodiesterase [Zhongshania aliphaticivorans]
MTEQKAKILIVDDEPASLETLCVMLEHGCDLIKATTAQEGLDALLSQNIDLVLLDVDLPDQSGFDVCKQIKSNSETAAVPVIFLTGYDGIVFEAQAFQAGAVDFITKPASPYRVLMRVNAHLKSEYYIELNTTVDV